MKKMFLLVMVLGCAAALQGQVVNYVQNFENVTGAGGWALNGGVESDYWSSASGYILANSYYPSKRLWFNQAGEFDVSAFRSFRGSRELAENQYFSSATVSGYCAHSTFWDDARLASYVWLLDENNNGYMGKYLGSSTYGTAMFLFKVVNGVPTTQLAAQWITPVNGKTLMLSIQQGVVTLTANCNGTVWTASATDSTYTQFTKIGFGGHTLDASQHNIDDVSFTGTVVTGPYMPVFSPAYPIITGLQPIKITCATSGVTIRYTTDGSEPTATNGTEIASGGSVSVNTTNTTLKARAFTGEYYSTVRSTTYTIPTSYNRPWVISKSDSITVDGNLTEWKDNDFIPLDKNYDGNGAIDVTQASYAAKWGSNGKIYIAVRVLDTAHYFTEAYQAWNARDAVEVYLHTQGTTGGYYGKWEIAQQYVAGIKAGTTNQLWTSLGDAALVPASANFQAAGKVVGSWIYYEFALTPFDYFGGYVGQSNIVSTLSENDMIGLDVCVVGNNNGTYTGMKGESTQTIKSENYTVIGLHKLVNEEPFLTLQWGPVVPNGSGGSAYYMNNNLVDNHALCGTISNGPWELDKTGTIIHSLYNANTAKSVVKVGDYIYYTYSGGSSYVYRSSASTWDTGTAVTISDNQSLASLATDGTYIYASTTKNSGTNQVSKYSVDAATGALTWVWTTTGIEATGVRGLSYYDGVTDYIYAVSGGRNAAGSTGNTAHLYAIRTDSGVVKDLGPITHMGETYQVSRVGRQLWVADALNTGDGQIYLYDLTNSTTLASTTPTAIYNPDGIQQIYGIAIDGNFVWMAGSFGQVCGYKFNKTQLAGDANEDDIVDVGDLSILAANYGGSDKTWSQGDFNSDGLVDVGDLSILAAHYGEGVNVSVDFSADYAKVFGTTVEDDIEADSTGSSSVCSGLGLPLIAGLVIIGLMLVKLEE